MGGNEVAGMAMGRREWLQGAGAIALGMGTSDLWADGKPATGGWIDTHTHFYDPTRPEGVPWPGKDGGKLYRTVLPPEFEKLGAKHGVTKTVIVEASPWLKDNDWLLGLVEKYSSVMGIVGNLDPSLDNFTEQVKRLAANPAYRGIRLSGDRVPKLLADKNQLSHLRAMEESGLILDLNCDKVFVHAVAIAKQFPKLRIVINHMGNVAIDGKTPPKEWSETLRPAAEFPLVWCKLSAVVEGSRKNDGTAPKDLNFYRPTLETLWKSFGGKKLVYGSNWPVSDLFATYDTVFELASTFVREQDADAMPAVFRDNAIEAYQLIKKG
ncbi:MAG: amidohydrolase family protein [Planctomycetaceae bacterium]